MFSNVQSVMAGTNFLWNGSISSDWNNPVNWTPNAIPDSVDFITIGAAPRPLRLNVETKITNLICNNSVSIDLNGKNLSLLGNFMCSSGSSIELHGGQLNINGNATFNGGILSDFDSTGIINCAGSSCIFGNAAGGPSVSAVVNISTLNVTFRSTTFNRRLIVTKRGSGNDNSYGNNIFNGVTEFINNGTGNILLANNVKDVFNNIVTFSNTGSAAIYPAYNDIAGTVFNDSIYVNSTSGNGIYFSGGTGVSNLVGNSKILVGVLGFSSGLLSLRHFITMANNNLSLSVGINSILSFGPASTFNGNVDGQAGGVLLNGATFNKKINLVKTGSGNNAGSGGNIFSDSASITNLGSGYLMSGNSNPDLFNSACEIINSGTSDIYLCHSSAGNIFNGTVHLDNSGSGTSNRIFVCEGSASSSVIFNSDLRISNQSNAGTAYCRFNLKGTTRIKSNLFIDNSSTASGTNGIYFGWNGFTGSATMDSLHSINLSMAGFSSGTLSLINFTKLGTDSVLLPLTSLAGITLGPSTIISGDFQSTSSAINLNGCNFLRTVNITKTGSTGETNQGGNCFASDVSINNIGSGNLTMANSLPDSFLTTASFENSGTGTIQLAQGSTGNLFNGKVYMKNNGRGASNIMLICEGAAAATAIFNDSLFIDNNSSAASAYLRFNLRGICTFNGNIIVNSTGGTGASTNGLYFGWTGYAGSASLAAGKHISIGSNGFTKGALSFIQFNKLGNEPDSIVLSGNSVLVFGPNLTWNGKLTASTGGIFFNGATFSDDVSITKTGSTSETSVGGNSFSKEFYLTNAGSGNLTLGNTSPDVFNGYASFTNSGTSYLQLANGSAGNTFNGKVSFQNSGSGSDNRILIAEGNAISSVTFNNDIEITNTANANISLIRFNLRGICTFNGNIKLNNTSGPATGSNGIYFGWTGFSGSANQVAGKNISFGNLGFATGNLQLIRFTQNGNESDSLMLGTSAALTLGPASRFGGNFISASGNLFMNGCRFDSTSNLKKTSSGNDNGAGGNVFTGKAIVINAGSGYLLLGNTLPDIFSNGLDLNNAGTSYIYLGHNSNGNQYSGDVTLNNIGTGTDTRILIGEGNALATNIFNGNVTVNNLSTSTDGFIRFNLRGTTTFNENIILNSIVGVGTNGINFGWAGFSGSATIALNKAITIGSSGFTKGTLSFQNFTQLGSTAQNFHLTGTAGITFGGNSIFGGNVNVISPELYFNGTTFNGTLIGEKTSNSNNNCVGNNVFNQNTEFINDGIGSWIFSNTTKDIYNGNLSVKNLSSGIIYLAHNDISGTQFNNNIALSNSLTGSIRFGQGTGTAALSNGKTLSFGTTGFANGTLYLKNFTQVGNASQSLAIPNGTAAIYFQTGTCFNGQIDVSFPQLYLNGSTFNGVSSFVKSGATNNSCNGGNVFNGNVTIRTTGTGNLYLANTTPDNFNGNVLFKQNGFGILYPAYNGMNNFRGDISTLGSDTVVTFASGTGTVNFSGSSPQAFYGDGIKISRLRRMSMNNSSSGLTLNVPISIYNSLAMINGNITTTATNILTMENGSVPVSSASDNSFVNGPMRKVGNQVFVFPVGKNGRCRTIAITAPGAVTDQYTAEYFYTDPNLLYNVSNKDVSLKNVSRCEYGSLTKVGAVINPFVTLSWNTNSCGVATVSDLRVARWNAVANKWNDLGNGLTTGSATAGTVLAASNFSVFNIFTLGSVGTTNVLPIELSSFNAKYEGDNVHVYWETMSEINNDYFTVEKSNDGFSFEKIGIVQGAGNSTIKNNYSFDDSSPFSGVSFYRLIQTDYNGKFEMFDPVSVKSKGVFTDFKVLSVMPNPFSDQLKVQYSIQEETNLTFELYSLSGSLVVHQEVPTSQGSTTFEFDQVADLPSGVFILKILANGNILYSNKVIKN